MAEFSLKLKLKYPCDRKVVLAVTSPVQTSWQLLYFGFVPGLPVRALNVPRTTSAFSSFLDPVRDFYKNFVFMCRRQEKIVRFARASRPA